MKFEILLSAMNQIDFSLLEKSNIISPTLIINQSDINEESSLGNSRMITTTNRGLSNSRNLALDYSKGELLLLSDDDEVFTEDLENKIVSAYEKLPEADIIIFSCSLQDYLVASNREQSKSIISQSIRQLSYLDVLKVASWQISFRSKSIKQSGVRFDEKLGAGSGNGAGEENKFLWDCLKNGLKIYYVPIEIATVAQQESTWFFGYDSDYFYNRGRTTRYIFGLPFSLIYAAYFIITKQKLYRKNISVVSASMQLFKGIFTRNHL